MFRGEYVTINYEGAVRAYSRDISQRCSGDYYANNDSRGKKIYVIPVLS